MPETENFTVYFPDYEGDYWEARYVTAVEIASDLLGLCANHASENVEYKIEFRKKDGKTDLRVKIAYKEDEDEEDEDDDGDLSDAYAPVNPSVPFPPASISLSEPLDDLIAACLNDTAVILLSV